MGDGRQRNEISWSGSIYYTVEKSNFFFSFAITSKNCNRLHILESQIRREDRSLVHSYQV